MPRFSLRHREPTIIMRADRAREAGQWQVAARLYRIALGRTPDNPPIWIQYGHALKESGNRAEAETAYRTAIVFAPDNADAHLQLGHVLKLEGRAAEAQASYVRALAFDHSLTDAARELSDLGWAEERLPEANGTPAPGVLATVAAMNAHATAGQPRDRKESIITLADRARDAGEWRAAAEHYRTALARNSDNPPIWVQYGHVLKETGELAQAEAAYRRALEVGGAEADTHLQLGHVLKMQGRRDEAAAAYVRALAIDQSLADAARELAGLGWSEDQLSQLRAASIEPVVPVSGNGRPATPRRGRKKLSTITHADRAMQLGKWELAVRLYRQALDRNPNNPPIWVQYGHALKESGRPDEAEASYRIALACDAAGADTHLQFGRVLKLQGKSEAAQTAYLCALARSPGMTGPLGELARLGWSDGQVGELQRLLAADEPAEQRRSARPNGSGSAPAAEPYDDDARLIQASGFFDPVWYLEQYEDVRRAGDDPLAHYLRNGAFEGRNPSPLFDSDWYLRDNLDVRKGGANPLLHYLRCGRAEGRLPLNPYAKWIELYDTITEDDRRKIAVAIGRLVDPPMISVVMPVYETPERYLRAAIESVRGQLYSHWELCIADNASPSPHVRRVLDEYRLADPRIKICYRSENGHICASSNSALAMAEGPFVALMDSDDILPEHALYAVAATVAAQPDLDLIYSDEDKIDTEGRRFDPYFKPDWSPDLMLSQNVFSHLGVYRRRLIEAIGGFRVGYEGSQDYDLVLRASVRTTPERICHIPHILYHWRAIPGSTAVDPDEKGYAVERARQALGDYLAQQGIAAKVSASKYRHYHRVQYTVPQPQPLVSLIIPTGGKTELLRTCIAGILEQTEYDPIELIILHNYDTRPEVLPYLDQLSRDPRVSIVACRSGFNFSRICNLGVSRAKGDIIGLINDDLEVIEPGWLEEMVSHAIRPGVGAVGALLYYPDDRIQHAGVIIGFGGVAGHAHCGKARGDFGYFARAALVQNFSAVTAACLLMPRSVYIEVGGFDEKNLPVAFNDVDFCLRIRERGYLIVWTPHAELYHHESATRGSDFAPEQFGRFAAETEYMKRCWGRTLLSDPYYSPNLTFSGDTTFQLAFPPRVQKPW